jgi:hypothetical protein
VEGTSAAFGQRVHSSSNTLTQSRAKGVKAIYTGLMPTHPGHFCAIIVWDTIHSHHKFQHSPAYNSFMTIAASLIAGDIQIAHLEITDKKSLKKALESPCTQISHLFIKKGSAADFIKAYNSSFEKYIVGEKFNGLWLVHSYEDPYILPPNPSPRRFSPDTSDTCRFSFYALLGWQSEKDHYEAMNKDGYKNFRASFKDCVNVEKDKGIKIYHIELRKVYGDL